MTICQYENCKSEAQRFILWDKGYFDRPSFCSIEHFLAFLEDRYDVQIISVGKEE